MLKSDKQGRRLGIDLAGNPDLAADPKVSAKIATEFWKTRSRAAKFGGGSIVEPACAGNIDGVTQGLNGGMNGRRIAAPSTAST